MIVAGIGFSSAASANSLRAVFELASTGYVVDALATAANKKGSKALTEFATATKLPIRYVEVEELARQHTLTSSTHSRAAYGTGSVAEAAALAVAGSQARLLSTRQISGDRLATCAIAIGGKI